MRKCAVLGCVLAVLALCLPQPVAAQDNAAEVSIGYSFLSQGENELAINESKLPLGLFFGAAFPMNDWISIATDVSAHYKRGIPASSSTGQVVAAIPTNDFQQLSFNLAEDQWCSPVLGDAFCEVHIQTVSGVGGPRFHFGGGGARPYFHIMAGGTRALRKIGFFAHTSTNFTVQPGFGVDVGSGSTAFRVEANYRRVFFGEPDQNNPGASLVSKDGADWTDFSVSFGVVWRVGQR